MATADDLVVNRRFRTKAGKRQMSKRRVLVIVRAYEDAARGGGMAVVYRYEDRPAISKHHQKCAMDWFLDHHEPITELR